MSALPDTIRLLLAVARALHATGYRRPYPAPLWNTGGRLRDMWLELDTSHYIEFQSAPEALPDQSRLIVRHGKHEMTWNGIDDVRDAITVLARLGAIGTCRTCDLPVPAGEVECETHARTTLNLPAFVVPAGQGRHSAHEAA